MIATLANISEYSHGYIVALHKKAMRINGVVQFFERSDGEGAHLIFHEMREGLRQVCGELQAAVFKCLPGEIDRNLVAG